MEVAERARIATTVGMEVVGEGAERALDRVEVRTRIDREELVRAALIHAGHACHVSHACPSVHAAALVRPCRPVLSIAVTSHDACGSQRG